MADLMMHETAEVVPAPVEGPGLLQALWRFRWSSLLIVVVCAALGVGSSLLLSQEKSAQAQFAVADPRGNTVFRQGVTTDASFVAYTAQRAAFTRSDVVLEGARSALAAQKVDISLVDLRKHVTSAVASDGVLVQVTATATTTARAAAIANAVVKAYSDRSLQDIQAEQAQTDKAITAARTGILTTLAPDDPNLRTRTAVDQASAQALAQLAVRSADAAVDASQFTDGTRFTDLADAGSATSTNNTLRNGAIGLLLGLLIASVVAFLRADRMLRRV